MYLSLSSRVEEFLSHKLSGTAVIGARNSMYSMLSH